jgi:hypothetical protein
MLDNWFSSLLILASEDVGLLQNIYGAGSIDRFAEFVHAD